MSASHNLFVCGTLRHGVDLEVARRLRASADWLGHAKARGRLYRITDYAGFVRAKTRNGSSAMSIGFALPRGFYRS